MVQRSRVLVTEEVLTECTIKETMDSQLIRALHEEREIILERLTEQERTLVKKLRTDFKLGRGEASALALAHCRELPLVTDDRLAMRVATLLGVGFVTALHFLIEAYESELIKREIALEKLDKLGEIGRYNERILADAKRHFGR